MERASAIALASEQLSTGAEPATHRGRDGPPDDDVALLSSEAEDFARGRGARTVATVDLLFAGFAHYGPLFDRVLYAAGASREELLDRLSGRAGVELSRRWPHRASGLDAGQRGSRLA